MMEWKKLFLLNVFLIQRQAQFVWYNILPKSLLSFLPPAVGVYSLARSSAWKLTRAQKVFQIFYSLSLFPFSQPLCALRPPFLSSSLALFPTIVSPSSAFFSPTFWPFARLLAFSSLFCRFTFDSLCSTVYLFLTPSVLKYQSVIDSRWRSSCITSADLHSSWTTSGQTIKALPDVH